MNIKLLYNSFDIYSAYTLLYIQVSSLPSNTCHFSMELTHKQSGNNLRRHMLPIHAMVS